jgi:hypothetical protein
MKIWLYPPLRSCCGKLLRALSLFLFASNCGAVIPAPEKLLPDDTLMMVTAPDFAKLRQIWSTSAQTRLWGDPALKPFKDKFLTRVKEEVIEPLERDLGVQLDDFAGLPQGQVTVALTRNSGSRGNESPALLLLVDSRDKSGRLKSNLADFRRKWMDSGRPIRAEQIRGIEFSILPISDKDIPASLKRFLSPSAANVPAEDSEAPPPPDEELVIGQFESLLVIGSSLKAVEKVAVHLTGGAMPALGDLAGYEVNRAALFRSAPLYGWIDVKSYIELLTPKPEGESEAQNPFESYSWEDFMAAVGLTGVKTLAFNLQDSDDGMLVQCFVGVPESARHGFLKIFPGEARESGPPPFVSADTVKFRRYRPDGQRAWTTLEKVLKGISPQWSGSLDSLMTNVNSAMKEKDPDFDVRNNILGNLGDDVMAYEKAPRGGTPAELTAPPSLFLISSPRAGELASALKNVFALLSQEGSPPAEREFLGRKIYSTPMPAVALPMSDPGRTLRSTVYISASGGYVAITSDVSLLEEFLRSGDGQQKALRDKAGLVDAAARAGGSSTGWFGYENRVETTRVEFEALRKSAANPPRETMLAPGIPAYKPESIKDWMDFSLLPPFEKIEKYFYFTVYTGSADADGLTFKLFAPVPPQLRK